MNEMKIAFTGKLEITRAEAIYNVIANGGSVKTEISHNVSHLVLGKLKNGTSSKLEKVYEINKNGVVIKIITGEEFLKMIK